MERPQTCFVANIRHTHAHTRPLPAIVCTHLLCRAHNRIRKRHTTSPDPTSTIIYVTHPVQLESFSHDAPSNCARCWSCCKIFGGWRIAPLYLAIGVALIMWPNTLWLSPVAGSMLIILALLRMFTIFRFNSHSKGGEGLLPQYDDTFDK